VLKEKKNRGAEFARERNATNLDAHFKRIFRISARTETRSLHIPSVWRHPRTSKISHTHSPRSSTLHSTKSMIVQIPKRVSGICVLYIISLVLGPVEGTNFIVKWARDLAPVNMYGDSRQHTMLCQLQQRTTVDVHVSFATRQMSKPSGGQHPDSHAPTASNCGCECVCTRRLCIKLYIYI
jgi:hypothetical protein